jgi:hypothetical protein
MMSNSMMQSAIRLFGVPLLVVLALVGVTAQTVKAQAPASAWTVRNVPVDVTAENATIARERAIVQGQRIAFDRLLERMTLAEDKAALSKPTDAELGGMIQNFEVQEERLSSVRYVAQLAFGFRPDAVRAFLNRTGTRSADTIARPALAFPVLESSRGTKLWEEPNPWRDAWADAKLGNRLTPIVVPLGDVLDVGNVSGEAVLAGRTDGIAAMLQRYGAESALIAVAADDGKSLKITMSTVGPQGSTVPESFSVPHQGKPDYPKAVEAVAQRLEANWKRQSISGRSPPMTPTSTWASPPLAGAPPQIVVGPPTGQAAGGSRMSVRFPISGLAEWTEARSRLARLPNSVRMELKLLNRNAAEFDLVYSGEEEALRQQLAQLGLSTNPAPGSSGAGIGRYELRLGAGLPAAQ